MMNFIVVVAEKCIILKYLNPKKGTDKAPGMMELRPHEHPLSELLRMLFISCMMCEIQQKYVQCKDKDAVKISDRNFFF